MVFKSFVHHCRTFVIVMIFVVVYHWSAVLALVTALGNVTSNGVWWNGGSNIATNNKYWIYMIERVTTLCSSGGP
jgi:hypothetical protein